MSRKISSSYETISSKSKRWSINALTIKTSFSRLLLHKYSSSCKCLFKIYFKACLINLLNWVDDLFVCLFVLFIHCLDLAWDHAKAIYSDFSDHLFTMWLSYIQSHCFVLLSRSSLSLCLKMISWRCRVRRTFLCVLKRFAQKRFIDFVWSIFSLSSRFFRWYYKKMNCDAFLNEWRLNSSFDSSLNVIVVFVDVTWSVKMLAFCWMLCLFNYQKSFLNIFSKRSIWSSLVTNSLTRLNCSKSFVTRKNFDTQCVETKSFKSLIKFVSRLFAHIFFRSSSNLEYFSNVCYIVCRDDSQK